MTPWPAADAYLARLPHGLSSYPECTTKASVLSAFQRHLRVLTDFDEAPPELATVLQNPRLPSAWLPSTYAVFVELMLYDQLGAQSFFDLARQINVDYLRSPLYRAAVRVFAPATLLRGAAFRWRHFHRGSSLNVQDVGRRYARLSLTYPPHLFDPIVGREKALTFEAAMQLAGARHIRAEVQELSNEEHGYVFSWTEHP